MKLSVLVPAYNEEVTIYSLLQAVVETCIEGGMEVLVIDDGSSDGTTGEFERFRESYNGAVPLRLLQKTNGGKGSAIRTGLSHATGEFILIQDADLEYNPRDYPALLAAAETSQSAAVYGSRNLARGNACSSLSFYWGGRLLSLLTNLLYGSDITDEATCYKLIRRDVLEKLNLTCRGFEFCPEVTAKLLRAGHSIREVPIGYQPRNRAEGKKIYWWHGLQAIWILVKHRFD